MRRRLAGSCRSSVQAFRNPVPSLRMVARLSHLQGNPKLLVGHLNNEPGAVVLMLRAGLCQVGGLQVGSGSPWHSAGLSTLLPSVPLQILWIPDLLILRTTMTRGCEGRKGTISSHKHRAFLGALLALRVA